MVLAAAVPFCVAGQKRHCSIACWAFSSSDELNKLATEHKENKLLGSLINALIVTKRFWEHVELKLTGVTINVTLGLLPKVTVEIN